MDGVIIDSEGFWQPAQIERLSCYGITITREECEHYTKGKRIDEIAQVWCPRYRISMDSPSLERQIISRVCAAIRAEGVVMTDLFQTLDYFNARGRHIAFATPSSQDIIQAVFDKLNLWHWFDVICSADDECYGKPHSAFRSLSDGRWQTRLASIGMHCDRKQPDRLYCCQTSRDIDLYYYS